jgi:hypothetical protein
MKNFRDAENKGKIKLLEPLDSRVPLGSQYEPMKKTPIPAKLAMKPTPEDYSIVTKLRAKLGVDNAQILRLALRKLAEAELKAS